MDIMSLGTCLPIIAICYCVGIGCKAWEQIPDKWIPFILAVLGGILGIAGMYIMPEFPAADWITAFAVGMMSGLAATGINQIYKQAVKK